MTDIARLEPPTRSAARYKIAARIKKPRVLTLDIETSPNLAHVWSLWNNNVGLSQLMEAGEVISFAAKWYGEPKIHFYSNHHDGHQSMVEQAFALMDEADAIVHYNGRSFDMKWLHTEFLTGAHGRPAPHKDIDLLNVVKATFRFPSNKLDYVAQKTGLGSKTSHTGHQLWVDCVIKNDPKAWALMKKYNIHDVRLTEQLYDVLRPWIRTHPHLGVLNDPTQMSCNHCGSLDLEEKGTRVAVVLSYPQYQCRGCGGWVYGGKGTRIAAARGL